MRTSKGRKQLLVQVAINSAASPSSPHSPLSPKPALLFSPVDSPIDSPTEKTDKVSMTKAVLRRSSQPGVMIGRMHERNQVLEWMRRSDTASLYICGVPGTGKTAMVMDCWKNVDLPGLFVHINCMTISTGSGVFSRILEEIVKAENVKRSPKIVLKSFLKREAHLMLEQVLTCQDWSDVSNCKGKPRRLTIVLDEMDYLIRHSLDAPAPKEDGTPSSQQDVLVRLFSLPHLGNSRVNLIGIANALDLTDRVLTKIKKHNASWMPECVRFAPYTHEEILAILKARLDIVQDKENTPPWVDQAALIIAARKASSTGDVRKALDVLKSAIEMAEKDAKNTGKPIKVTPIHVTRVANASMGTTNRHVELFKGLGILHQILLVSLCVASRRIRREEGGVERAPEDADAAWIVPAPNQPVPTQRLQEAFYGTCEQLEVPGVSKSEFTDLMVIVRENGLILSQEAKKSSPRAKSSPKSKPHQDTVQIQMSEEDILRALEAKSASTIEGGPSAKLQTLIRTEHRKDKYEATIGKDDQ
jgi:cell division control protein 6